MKNIFKSFCFISIASILFLKTSTVQAEQIDSIVWTLLNAKKSPVEFNITHSSDWQQPRYLDSKRSDYKGIIIDSESWTFPLVAATKITAFKEELTLYSDWYKGKTKSDLESAQRIFAAYGASFGGNYDEHWNSCINDEEAEKFDAAKMKLISSLKDPAIKNKLWDFVEPALRHQLRVMEIKYQGVVISTFEYVRDYFGITYDIEKAREWYLKDTTTGQFAYQDYLGREHAARKVTALIERCIFKHAIFSISEVKSWIKKTETWLQETTGDNYSASKKYWE